MQVFSDDIELSLFPTSNDDGIPQGLKTIQYMIELDYLDPTVNPMRFTEAGVDYMFQNHREFLHNIMGKDFDFGFCEDQIRQFEELASEYGLDPRDTATKFQLENSRRTFSSN
jgi:hypothetical protein